MRALVLLILIVPFAAAESVSFHWDGSVGLGVWVRAAGTPLVSEGISGTWNNVYFIGATDLEEVHASMTWASSNPLDATMEIALHAYVGCGAGCIQSERAILRVQGTSPLALDVAGFALAPGETGYFLGAGQPELVPEPTEVFVQVPKSFDVDGVLVSR